MTNIHRLPTKAETIAGAVVSAILTFGLGFLIWYFLRAAFKRPEILGPFAVGVMAVLGLICAWSAALLFRILFSKPTLPSLRGQIAIGYGMILMGTILCLFSLFAPPKHPPILYFAQGVVGIGFGLIWVRKARKALHA